MWSSFFPQQSCYQWPQILYLNEKCHFHARNLTTHGQKFRHAKRTVRSDKKRWQQSIFSSSQHFGERMWSIDRCLSLRRRTESIWLESNQLLRYFWFLRWQRKNYTEVIRLYAINCFGTKRVWTKIDQHEICFYPSEKPLWG